VPDDTVGEPGPASSSGDEKAIHEPQANSKFDNVLNAPRPGVNDALEPPIAHIAARSGRVKPNDVSTTSMPPSPATGPMAGLIAQDPLAVQEGCHACKSSKNELDEHILKRAAQMHDMLDVGDDAGIRHDYLTACNEIKYQCLTLNMVKKNTLHRATRCPPLVTRHAPSAISHLQRSRARARGEGKSRQVPTG
jgi:hypothetical protein